MVNVQLQETLPLRIRTVNPCEQARRENRLLLQSILNNDSLYECEPQPPEATSRRGSKRRAVDRCRVILMRVESTPQKYILAEQKGWDGKKCGANSIMCYGICTPITRIVHCTDLCYDPGTSRDYNCYSMFSRGETGLRATREEREKSEQEHDGVDLPVSPHKVDFVILTSVAHDHKLAHFELSEYEHKKHSASDEEWSIQLRKSLRHNHAIMAHLPGIDDLHFLYIRGKESKGKWHRACVAATFLIESTIPHHWPKASYAHNPKARSGLACGREPLM